MSMCQFASRRVRSRVSIACSILFGVGGVATIMYAHWGATLTLLEENMDIAQGLGSLEDTWMDMGDGLVLPQPSLIGRHPLRMSMILWRLTILTATRLFITTFAIVLIITMKLRPPLWLYWLFFLVRLYISRVGGKIRIQAKEQKYYAIWYFL